MRIDMDEDSTQTRICENEVNTQITHRNNNNNRMKTKEVLKCDKNANKLVF